MKSPEKDEYRLFNSNILEILSRSNTPAVISIYYMVSAVILFTAFERYDGYINSGIIIFLVGIFLFSLTEYLIHRFVYHSPRLKRINSWFYKVHEIHHEQPHNKRRLTLPLIIAVIAGGILYFLFRLILRKNVNFFFPGFLSGYASYLLIHYTIHTSNFKNRVFRYLWKHHAVHHFKDETRAYGVSSPLWDIIFGTMPSKEQLNP